MAETKRYFHQLKLGAHISASGGLYKAFERGAAIGCSSMQIFTKSNQQWYAKPITQDEINLFTQTKKEYQHIINPIVVHASYLINLCSENPETEKKSIEGLIIELQRCEMLDLPYLVFHPGSSGKQNRQDALKQLQKNINLVLQETSGKTTLVLENMAGQGSGIARSLEDLRDIIEHIHQQKKIGVCIDTCHAFAAGYNIGNKKGYDDFFDAFDRLLGFAKLYVIHLNDSKKECGQRIDRHEEIGKGKIGLELFSLIMNDPRFFDVPKIIEIPVEYPGDDEKNLEILKSLLTEKTKQLLHYQNQNKGQR